MATGSSTNQSGGKGQADKANSKPKQTLDEKAKVGVQGGFLFEEEQKTYMAEQRCFFCHTKGHRKQDCMKWKAKQASSTIANPSTSTVTVATPATTTATATTSAISSHHQVPSLHSPIVYLEDKQKGEPLPSSLLRAYGSAQGHKFIVLFDTRSSEDLISP